MTRAIIIMIKEKVAHKQRSKLYSVKKYNNLQNLPETRITKEVWFSLGS